MKDKQTRILLIVWGILFLACAGLGFVPEPEGAARWALTILGAAFFVPGTMLLWRCRRDRDVLGLIRNLSAASLGLTAVLLIANVVSVLASERVGQVLYALLVVISAPMVCLGPWIVSLFLWACLLIASLMLLRREKKSRGNR